MKNITIEKIKSWKNNKRPFSVITAYDYATAKIVDDSKIPIILVGDSASMISYGYSTTLPIEMEELLLVTRAVSRAATNSFVVGDMPFLSYQTSTSSAIRNAGLLLKGGGVEAVKLEGGMSIASRIKKIVSCGIPVMGHIGLTPQSVNQLSGNKIQGKSLGSAQKILDDARSLEDAGVFSVVLECIPQELSKLITSTLSIPTIGIGAGKFCDGQVQVFHDILGLLKTFHPKHAKKYTNLYKIIYDTLNKYYADVSSKKFPTTANYTSYKKNIVDKLK